MPSITFDWIKKNTNNTNINKEYTTFIETGTYQGETILHMENYFKKLHTIEIQKKYYDLARNRYFKKNVGYLATIRRTKPKNKIKFHLGDSSKVISDLCPKINTKAIFFLDGHWSSGDTGKGEKDVPLYEELHGIMNKFENECIIIIDDCRLFGKGPNTGELKCNWEDIKDDKIIEMVKNRLEKHYYASSNLDKNDRLILFLKRL